MSGHSAKLWKSRITLLLAVWLAFLGGSTSLVHAHGGSEASHDLGWLTLAGESTETDTEARHRHRIILGIEFPAESCPEGLGDDPDAVASTPVNAMSELSSTLHGVIVDSPIRIVQKTTRSPKYFEKFCNSCLDKGRHRITGVARL